MEIQHSLGKKLLFFDGGMGALLQDRGLSPGEMPETWNLYHKEEIQKIHEQYYRAGCHIATTNTFGANRLKLQEKGLSVNVVVQAAVELANNARKAVSAPENTYVALDIGPTGRLLKPMGDLSFDDAYNLFAEIVTAGQEGADCIIIETMGDTHELKAAVLAAKENSNLPIFASVTLDTSGKLLTGGDLETAVCLLEGLGVAAMGLNCGLGPIQMKPLIKQMLSYASIPVFCSPNAGLPKNVAGTTKYDISPEQFAEVMEEIALLKGTNPWILGGCCGTTPEYLEKTISKCRNILPRPICKKESTVVCSYSQTVEIGSFPILIGERINPTGKKHMKVALAEGKFEVLLQEGIRQEQNGAHLLDVNVGVPGLNEKELMEKAITGIQGILSLPLQLDTSDVSALERGMRIYNGKPMVNSVNGKRESMEAVFPLLKHYGGVTIALPLDENGIPPTAEGRLAVATKIVDTAATYGISKKDILIDGLAMAVSSDPDGARVTLRTLELIKKELGVGTVLGVSNISFGLPAREQLNSVFFALALQQGLSAGIVNPNSEKIMDVYYAYLALLGLDKQCKQYIERFSQNESIVKAESNQANSLQSAVEHGLREHAAQAAKMLLNDLEPLEIIEKQIIPGLNIVGQKYEAGTLFLPQLLMSAEAAKEAFAIVQSAMDQSQGMKKGKIILATVKGDVHDIGKNIVHALLENYGYDVIDLGKDVDPDTVVAETLKQSAPLVGLSALMTTTVGSMEKTIQQLQKSAPHCHIMVGGAVLTEGYALQIGADCYCKDAMASVRFAEEVLAANDTNL